MNIKIETAIDEKIPMDSDLVYGKLENGLSYPTTLPIGVLYPWLW